ncbi:MAG: transporter substrate-binding domain-containing protein [Anaerorhabdus sp.]
MKKLGLMLVMTSLLVGCTSTSETNEVTSWSESLIQENVISIGVAPDYPPYESLSATGELEGFDIDFMNAVLEAINENNDGEYTIEWVQLEFSTIITSMQMGQLDLGVSGFTYDEERDVLFSTPYIDSSTLVVTNASSEIKSLADLEGKVIGAQLGSTGEAAAKEIANAEVIGVGNVNILMESLKTNAYDAVVLDQGVAMSYVENAGFVLIDEALIDDSMYVVAKTDKTLLMDEINAAIETVKASDKYQELLEKWGLK